MIGSVPTHEPFDRKRALRVKITKNNFITNYYNFITNYYNLICIQSE